MMKLHWNFQWGGGGGGVMDLKDKNNMGNDEATLEFPVGRGVMDLKDKNNMGNDEATLEFPVGGGGGDGSQRQTI